MWIEALPSSRHIFSFINRLPDYRYKVTLTDFHGYQPFSYHGYQLFYSQSTETIHGLSINSTLLKLSNRIKRCFLKKMSISMCTTSAFRQKVTQDIFSSNFNEETTAKIFNCTLLNFIGSQL